MKPHFHSQQLGSKVLCSLTQRQIVMLNYSLTYYYWPKSGHRAFCGNPAVSGSPKIDYLHLLEINEANVCE